MRLALGWGSWRRVPRVLEAESGWAWGAQIQGVGTGD